MTDECGVTGHSEKMEPDSDRSQWVLPGLQAMLGRFLRRHRRSSSTSQKNEQLDLCNKDKTVMNSAETLPEK